MAFPFKESANLTGHTRSSRRLPYSEVGPGPVDLEAVASMADLAAAAAVIAGPPTPVEMRLFSVGSNSSLESASSDNSEPMRFRSFSDIDLTRHQPSELISFRSNAYFSGPAILPIDPPERFMVAGEN